MARMRTVRIWAAMVLALGSGLQAQAEDAATEDARGIALFQNCVRCHTLTQGGEHRFGPNLHGLMTRGIAGAPDFDYSPALEALPGNWTRKSLNAFVAKPHLAVPDNDMPYAGLMNPHDRADLLDWLVRVSADVTLAERVDHPLIGAESGDTGRGARLFRTCRVCHSYQAGADHKIGPNLFGILYRPIASADGFFYAGELARVEGVWTPEALDRFLLSKKEFKQGTHRAFKELRGPLDRADLIAYLATLKAAEQ